MKLLDWMQRKSRRKNNEPTKNFTIGGPSTCFLGQVLFEEQKYYAEPEDNNSWPGHPNKVEQVLQEESSDPFAFLSIGTLGSELTDTDPPTPTFPEHFENVTTNEETEIGKKDVNLIKYELEKFLEVEDEEIGNDSSQRSSLASIITICKEGIEGAVSEANESTVAFPPQNSIFASSIHELAWITVEPDKEKASYEELFMKNKRVDDNPKGKCEGSKKQEKGNYVKHIMKKMMSKLHCKSKRSIVTSTGDTTKSSPITRKFPKELKVFHKKVHPEGSITGKHFMLQNDMAMKRKGDHQIEKDNSKQPSQTANIKKLEHNAVERSSNGIRKVASMVNSEHWIRTDADYLVLEL